MKELLHTSVNHFIDGIEFLMIPSSSTTLLLVSQLDFGPIHIDYRVKVYVGYVFFQCMTIVPFSFAQFSVTGV